MNTTFDLTLAGKYKSNSQIARVLTESWVSSNMFCPKCGNPHINHFENNRPVADFFCDKCKSEFELKSKKGSLGRVIADGAYDTMISRITSRQSPNFMFMSYSMSSASVTNLLYIPNHFLTPNIIEKRKPLSATARRAGWVGCNILFNKIPEQGRISIIKDGVETNKEATLRLVKKASSLELDNLDSQGWLLDVLNCVNKIQKSEFILNDVYKYETQLQMLHPNNNNVRAKIRQQLQILRDLKFIEFLGNGHYRKVN